MTQAAKGQRHPARPYMRPMRGWWRRDPFFMRYMLREVTAIAVAVYALVLAVGVLRLSQGEAAWNAWLDGLRAPGSLLLHLLLLIAFAIHAVSWFAIMPKTLPMILVRGQRLSDPVITRSGWAATVLASLVLLALAWGWQP